MTEEEIKKYLELTSQKEALEDLIGHINTAQQGCLNVWKTGFSYLDDMLDGGFLGGNLILLGAVSSLGKTTFALQIADNIAAAGQDVLIFSLEMTKKELNAKSISRNTFLLTDDDDDIMKRTRQEYRLTMGDILRGRVGLLGEEKRKLFDEAFDLTSRLNDHIFILRDNDISVDNVAQLVQTHKEARNGRKPFVIIDYLQILKPSEGSTGKRSGDKRMLTDEDVNKLKDLAVKQDVPIMVISSFNRASYLDPVSMGSFKESGTIEYSGDVLIGLQYSGMRYQKHYFTNKNGKKTTVFESKIEHDTRVRMLLDRMDEWGSEGYFLPIDVVLMKNRGVGKGRALFEFCPKYNIYKEMSILGNKQKNKDLDDRYNWNREANIDESGSNGTGDSQSAGESSSVVSSEGSRGVV